MERLGLSALLGAFGYACLQCHNIQCMIMRLCCTSMRVVIGAGHLQVVLCPSVDSRQAQPSGQQSLGAPAHHHVLASYHAHGVTTW